LTAIEPFPFKMNYPRQVLAVLCFAIVAYVLPSLFLSPKSSIMLRSPAEISELSRFHSENMQSEHTLTGTWLLTSYVVYVTTPLHITYAWHPLGKNATGILIYSTDGYMSAQLMEPGCLQFKSDTYHVWSEQECSEAAQRYMAYAGKYLILSTNSSETIIQHSVHVSLFPNWLGSDQQRIASTDGKNLVIRPIVNKKWPVSAQSTDGSAKSELTIMEGHDS
jgi:hypothetical protein